MVKSGKLAGLISMRTFFQVVAAVMLPSCPEVKQRLTPYREHSRALLRPQFSRDQVADLNLEETHVQHMFKHLSTSSGWTPQIDLSPLFFRLTIDSATEFLFGQSIQSQVPSTAEEGVYNAQFNWNSLADAFDRGTAVLGVRSRLSGLYWLYKPKQFEQDCKEVHRFADYFVNLALQQTGEPLGEEKSKYVFLRELAKTNKDPIELRSQLLNILLAGRDTTAGLLGWTCWNLARHPSIYNKLRTTIVEAFGTYNNPHQISFSSLKSCTYLQHVLKETLRLFPSVPLNARQAARDTTLPLGGGPDGTSPVYIKKGQEVGYSVYVMQRREDLWGKDAAIFNPDRWADRKMAGWEYLPFNGGPRICLGQQFALTEVGYVLTRLIQKFDRMENCNPQDEAIHHYSVTSAPKQVLVKLHEA
jgi:cytochrome P450